MFTLQIIIITILLSIVISNIYGWFDWYLNVNLFFTQVDIVVFNIISDILSQIVICRYYLKNKNEGFQLIDSQL